MLEVPQRGTFTVVEVLVDVAQILRERVEIVEVQAIL